MKGPFDDTQDNQASLTEGAASVQTGRSSRKPPGGKALLRLLDLLESRGLSEAAAATVAAAVPEEQKADYASRLASPHDAGAGSRRRRRIS